MNKTIKKTALCLLALFVSVGAFSQQHKHETFVSGSLGFSPLKYDLNVGKQSGKLGYSFGIGQKYFFSEQCGISLGVEGAQYRSMFQFDKLEYHENILDYLYGEVNYKAIFPAYKEHQTAFLINIPIMFHYQTSGKHKFQAALGGKLNIPMSISLRQEAVKKIITSGYALADNIVLNSPMIDGYGEFDVKETDKRTLSDAGMKKTIGFMGSAEAGMKWKLSERFYLYTGAYIDYGFTAIAKPIKAGASNHFFPHYAASTLNSLGENQGAIVNSVLNSRYTYDNANKGVNFLKNDKLSALSFGLKLAIGFGYGDVYKSKAMLAAEVELLATEAALKATSDSIDLANATAAAAAAAAAAFAADIAARADAATATDRARRAQSESMTVLLSNRLTDTERVDQNRRDQQDAQLAQASLVAISALAVSAADGDSAALDSLVALASKGDSTALAALAALAGQPAGDEAAALAVLAAKGDLVALATLATFATQVNSNDRSVRAALLALETGVAEADLSALVSLAEKGDSSALAALAVLAAKGDAAALATLVALATDGNSEAQEILSLLAKEGVAPQDGSLGFSEIDLRKQLVLTVDNYVINDFKLSKAWKAKIDAIIEEIDGLADYNLFVEGHACELGSDVLNQELSKKRAEMIKEYLISKGFSADKIKTEGLGKRAHILPNKNLSDRKKNRRVVLFVLLEKN